MAKLTKLNATTKEEGAKKVFFENPKIVQLLTIDDLCKWLQVKKSFIRDLIYQRRIPFRKVGKLIRFEVDQILSWLEMECNSGGY